MNVLSLTLGYPNGAEPGLALFVRSRLQAIAKHASVTAIAPIPLIDYSNPTRRLLQTGIPFSRQDGEIAVFHPRWLFPPGGTPVNVVCLFVRIACLLRNRRISFDVIDAQFGYPEGIAAALLAIFFRRPFTVTLRGLETAFARYRWRRVCMKWALCRAAAVVTVSRALGDFAAQLGVERERIHTIPNGIDRDVFYPRDVLEARKKFGIPSSAKVIVSAGELIEAKGHHLVIQSIRDLVDSERDITLLIAGGVARGGRRFDTELAALVADLKLSDRVQFLGWLDRNEMAELMSAADVFSLASYSEGWPNVVNEALACGAPVVASAVGAVPDMIPSERYGITVPPRDQERLTAALAAALDRKWDRAAIAEWGGSRSWNRVATEVISVLQTVLDDRVGLLESQLISTKIEN